MLAHPLILMRHGQVDIAEGMCYGHLDVSLNALGRQSSLRAARHWSLPIPTKIYASDLLRARETADIVSQQLGAIPVCVLPELREICFGSWEGSHWEDIYQNDPEAMNTWGQAWISTRPPQGENVWDLFFRINRATKKILAEMTSTTLIVAHHGSLRALMCQLKRKPPSALLDQRFEFATPQLLS